MSFSFSSLNLSNVKAQGAGYLEPGRYVCRITEAGVKPSNDGRGRYLEVKFADVDGIGEVVDRITLSHPNAEAERIGLGRLKAILQFGGHPNPNNPGDVRSMIGLYIGVRVEEGDEYTKDGETKKGPPKPARSGAYFDPSNLGFIRPSKDFTATTTIDDAIPF